MKLNENKGKMLTLRMTDIEYVLFKAHCDKYGMTVSQYLRGFIEFTISQSEVKSNENK